MSIIYPNGEQLSYLLSRIESQRGRGESLPKEVRIRMERAFNQDFSDICIHQGAEPALIGALAFTCGNEIYVTKDLYDPWSKAGQFLLGHELAHVVQQRQGRVGQLDSQGLAIISDPALELEANLLALHAVTGIPCPLCTKKPELTNYPTAIQCMVTGFKTIDELSKSLQSEKNLGFTLQSPITAIFLDLIWHQQHSWTYEEIKKLTNEDIQVYVKSTDTAAKKIQRKYRISQGLKTTLNMDHIQDKRFTTLRREQLAELKIELYLAEQYGLQTVIDGRSPEKQPGLRIFHENSTAYLRDKYENATQLFQQLRTRVEQKEDYQEFMKKATGYELAYVNSKFLRKTLPLFVGSLATIGEFYQLGENIFLMSYQTKSPNLVTNALKAIGATPSSYQAIKELARQNVQTNPEIDCAAQLNQLLKSEAYIKICDLAQTKTNPLAHLHYLITVLVAKLTELSSLKNFKNSPTIKTALQSIQNLLTTMSLNPSNALHTTRLYELVINELYMILAILHPYDTNSLRKTVRDILLGRVPVLQTVDLPPTIYLASSGMDALGTAFAAALTQHQEEKGTIYVKHANAALDYFELADIVFKAEDYGAKCKVLRPGDSTKANIIFATLNPSSPTAATNIKEVTEFVTSEIQKNPSAPTTLIIDSTIEIDKGTDGQLNKLITGLLDFIVKTQNLNIILAKSYQKYASLGTAKIMSGVVVAIDTDRFAKCTEFLNEASLETAFIQLDENQLMCYLLQYANEAELILIQDAAVNAKFVRENCWPGKYVDLLPFFLEPIEFCTLDSKEVNILTELSLEKRDSFSFLNTSFLPVKDGFRINVGQEPQHRLVEMFYAPGQMIKLYREKSQTSKANLTYSDLRQQLTTIGTSTFKENKLASYLEFAHIFFLQSLNDKEKLELISLYRDFLNSEESVKKLSPEMRAKLVTNWLEISLSIGQIDAQELEKVLAKIFYVPPYLRANFFIHYLPEESMAKLPPGSKRKITQSLLRGQDFLTSIFICQEVIKTGQTEKAKATLELVVIDYLLNLRLTAKSFIDLTELPEELLKGLQTLENVEFRTESEFWEAVQKQNPGQIISDTHKAKILAAAKEGATTKERVLAERGLLVENLTQDIMLRTLQDSKDITESLESCKEMLEYGDFFREDIFKKLEEIKTQLLLSQIIKHNVSVLQTVLKK